jgi:hydrogenase maturation protease
VGTEAAIRVLGIGSPFGADRLGLDVAETLKSRFDAKCVAVIACDRPGARLLEDLRGASAVLLIDAVRSSGAPSGTLHRLEGDAIPHQLERHTSTHGFGLAEAIALARELNELPQRLILLGAEMGTGTTETVERVAQAAVSQIGEWLAEIGRGPGPT